MKATWSRIACVGDVLNLWPLVVLTTLYPVWLTSIQFQSTLDDFNLRFQGLSENYKNAMLTQIAVDVGQVRNDMRESKKAKGMHCLLITFAVSAQEEKLLCDCLNLPEHVPLGPRCMKGM